MKLELNVVRFENEDVIATSCQYESHFYTTNVACPKPHGATQTFLEWEDGEWYCYEVGDYYVDAEGHDITSGMWHWVGEGYDAVAEPCSDFPIPTIPTTADGVSEHFDEYLLP